MMIKLFSENDHALFKKNDNWIIFFEWLLNCSLWMIIKLFKENYNDIIQKEWL